MYTSLGLSMLFAALAAGMTTLFNKTGLNVNVIQAVAVAASLALLCGVIEEICCKSKGILICIAEGIAFAFGCLYCFTQNMALLVIGGIAIAGTIAITIIKKARTRKEKTNEVQSCIS